MNKGWLDHIQRYGDGQANAEEVAELQEAMKADAALRARFLDYMNLDVSLSAAASMHEPSMESEVLSASHRSPRRRWRPLAWAALIPLVGLGIWLATRTSEHLPAVEVEIVQLREASFASPQTGLRERDHVKTGSLNLQKGEAQLRLPSEVNLVMSGPAEVRFVDAMHARVLRGKVTVDVGSRGKGFILDTPVTRVVDLGTRFGVEAKTDGRTDVTVLEGRVELVSLQQAQRTAALEQGEAVRVDTTQAMARIVNITGGSQPGEWSTQPPPDDCQIVSVSDNFGASEGFHFYRIVPHGLRPGAVVYTNRRYVWTTADGKDFPASLLNADVVQTFHGELRRPDYAIEVTVARPVELFVLMPRRGIPAPWLTKSFTRTGEELFLDEFTPGVRPHLFFEVWKRTVTQAGKVVLGPANRDANGNPLGMYGIAARAL